VSGEKARRRMTIGEAEEGLSLAEYAEQVEAKAQALTLVTFADGPMEHAKPMKVARRVSEIDLLHPDDVAAGKGQSSRHIRYEVDHHNGTATYLGTVDPLEELRG
jgi:hypothetical protein